MLTKLARETLAERAARNLQLFIEAHDLKPGNLLPPESQLAADLGVSRQIIREALKSLEGKGIITIIGGKGSIVKPPDSQQLQLFFQRTMQIEREAIIDLMELRKGIEIQSAALAAERRSLDEVTQLASIVAEMRRNLRNPDAYVALDVTFHQCIAAATRNTMLYQVVKAIRDALNATLHERLLRRQSDDQLECVQTGHETILLSLEQGDARAAERAMAAHFDEAILSLLSNTQDQAAAPGIPTAE